MHWAFRIRSGQGCQGFSSGGAYQEVPTQYTPTLLPLRKLNSWARNVEMFRELEARLVSARNPPVPRVQDKIQTQLVRSRPIGFGFDLRQATTIRTMPAMTSDNNGLVEVMHRRAGARTLLLMLMLSLSCGGARKGASKPSKYDPNVARYRLLLRENPIDSGEAFRCYAACQDLTQPDAYLGCLSKCPAFEVTKGVACAPYELPPETACITARRLPAKQEIDPAYKVVAVIAGVALIVALGVPCTSSTSCGAYYYAAPR